MSELAADARAFNMLEGNMEAMQAELARLSARVDRLTVAMIGGMMGLAVANIASITTLAVIIG